MKRTKRLLPRCVSGFCLLAGVLCLVLWAVGFRRYTTLGIDSDRRDSSTSVCCRYCRVRWPGDGSFRLGGGVYHYRLGSKKIEPFDWGGRFFQAPRRDTPRSFANRLGFWWIQKKYDDEWSLQSASVVKPSEFWIGVPGILPAMVFAALFWLCRSQAASDKMGMGQKYKNTTAFHKR